MAPSTMPRRAAETNVGTAVAILIVAAVVSVLLGSTVLMVLWGALALTFGFQTIGYGSAVLVYLGLSVLGGFFRSSIKR